MKLLVGAGLVSVRRSGRERWNRLNALPIQRIYRRWIRSFEAAAADAVLRRERIAGRPTEEPRP